MDKILFEISQTQDDSTLDNAALKTRAFYKSRKDSHSREHTRAEGLIREKLSTQLGVPLRAKKRLMVGPKQEVEVDAFSLEPRIAVEIYAHVGGLKSAQKHKIGNDILKLALLRQSQPVWRDARLILAFASKAAMRSVRNTWHFSSIEAFGIEFLQIDIGREETLTLEQAQKRQDRTRHLNSGRTVSYD